jgi:long-chain acyl-CoA synthetase
VSWRQADVISEYVALEKLEGIYALDPIFASLLVHADPVRSHLVALAVCDPMQAAKLVSSVLKQNVTSSDIALLEKAVKDKRVRNAVVQSMGQVGKENKLNG